MTTAIATEASAVQKPKRNINKRLSSEFYNSNQSWYFESLWNFKGEKVCVKIRRNAYDCQSHLKVEIYDPNKRIWNLLTSKPIETAHCKCVSYVETKEQINQRYGNVFAKDEDDLLVAAGRILS